MTTAVPARLLHRREIECRLVPARRLRDLESAREFLRDRGMLTVLPSCSLPSLFGSTEPPADMSKRGWARWPPDIWWWDNALAEHDGVAWLKILGGKGVYVDERLFPVLDPLCRDALRRAEDGELGGAAARLVDHLRAAGPTQLDDLKAELGLGAKELQACRRRLEPLGAITNRSVELPAANGGHRHTGELWRWDHIEPRVSPISLRAARADLLVAAVRAAVVAPDTEAAAKWFGAPVPAGLVDECVADGRLVRPAMGWLSAPE